MSAADQTALAAADYYGGGRQELRGNGAKWEGLRGNGAKWEDSQVGTGPRVRFQIRVPIRVEQEAKETQHTATIIRWHAPFLPQFPVVAPLSCSAAMRAFATHVVAAAHGKDAV